MNGRIGGQRRLAFFGGSFDPPHLGHLAIARAARDALALDTVAFAPVGAQPLKPHGSTATFADRLAMTKLAIMNEDGFAVSMVDAPHPDGRPNYTLDTLRALRADLGGQDQLFCLMGADSFAHLGHWRGGAEIPFAAALIVASRPGQKLDDLTALLPRGVCFDSKEVTTEPFTTGETRLELRTYRLRNATGDLAPFYLLPNLDVEISASEIRQHASAGSDSAAKRFLPASVAAYIEEHRLYF